MTVAEWLTTWLRDEATPSVRPRTLIAYESVVRRHLIPALGHKNLRRITASDVRAFMNAQSANGLKPRTVSNHHIVLRRALEIAVRYGYVEKNVARLVSAPRAERFEPRPLSGDEARRFLDAARGNPLEALFLLAASTGMRQAEVLGQTWKTIDLETGLVKVERTLVRYDSAYHMDAPKTPASRRTIAIAGPVVEVLRRHRTRQLEQQLSAGPAWVGNAWDLAFTDELGQPLHNRAVRYRFDKLLDAAGVRHVRFHDLRHGLATFLLTQGVSMKVVQDVLGHAQISMTMNVYAHVVPELRRDAAERIGEVLFGTAG